MSCPPEPPGVSSRGGDPEATVLSAPACWANSVLFMSESLSCPHRPILRASPREGLRQATGIDRPPRPLRGRPFVLSLDF